jgi:phosphatidylserine decarboxylase
MIKIWDRKNKELIVEKVYAGKIFNILYGKRVSYFITKKCLEKKWFSILYGLTKKTSLSKKEIPKFIENYQINMKEFEKTTYQNFNDFFKRKFNKTARLFPKDSVNFGSICEGRVTAVDQIRLDQEITIKNNKITLLHLLGGDNKLAAKYDGGSLIIFRLAPVDYHRFHSPSSGKFTVVKKISARLHSVNPASTKRNPYTLVKNSRLICEILSENKPQAHSKKETDFCLIAVGAFCVGSIHTLKSSSVIEKYDDLGFFEFGGSTVVLLAPKNSLMIDRDIIEKTKKGVESFIRLGEKMGVLQTAKS